MDKAIIVLALVFVVFLIFVYVMYPDITHNMSFDREPPRGFVDREETKKLREPDRRVTGGAIGLEYDWDKGQYVWDCHYNIKGFDYICYKN